jgi:DNA/RNA-binding domain of Phe-tRNA-synthetase-like protein
LRSRSDGSELESVIEEEEDVDEETMDAVEAEDEMAFGMQDLMTTTKGYPPSTEALLVRYINNNNVNVGHHGVVDLANMDPTASELPMALRKEITPSIVNI